MLGAAGATVTTGAGAEGAANGADAPPATGVAEGKALLLLMNGLAFHEPNGLLPPSEPVLPQKPPTPPPIGVPPLKPIVDGVVGPGDVAPAATPNAGNIPALGAGNPPKVEPLVEPGQPAKAVVDDARLGLVGVAGTPVSSFLPTVLRVCRILYHQQQGHRHISTTLTMVQQRTRERLKRTCPPTWSLMSHLTYTQYLRHRHLHRHLWPYPHLHRNQNPHRNYHLS